LLFEKKKYPKCIFFINKPVSSDLLKFKKFLGKIAYSDSGFRILGIEK